MADLIERQKTIDAVKEYFKFSPLEGRQCAKAIERVPSVQPRKGKWIPVDSYSAFGGDEATWMAHGNPVAFYYCSECKEQTYAGEDGESLITKYCPNCGCRMEEGDSDE